MVMGHLRLLLFCGRLCVWFRGIVLLGILGLLLGVLGIGRKLRRWRAEGNTTST